MTTESKKIVTSDYAQDDTDLFIGRRLKRSLLLIGGLLILTVGSYFLWSLMHDRRLAAAPKYDDYREEIASFDEVLLPIANLAEDENVSTRINHLLLDWIRTEGGDLITDTAWWRSVRRGDVPEDRDPVGRIITDVEYLSQCEPLVQKLKIILEADTYEHAIANGYPETSQFITISEILSELIWRSVKILKDADEEQIAQTPQMIGWPFYYLAIKDRVRLFFGGQYPGFSRAMRIRRTYLADVRLLCELDHRYWQNKSFRSQIAALMKRLDSRPLIQEQFVYALLCSLKTDENERGDFRDALSKGLFLSELLAPSLYARQSRISAEEHSFHLGAIKEAGNSISKLASMIDLEEETFDGQLRRLMWYRRTLHSMYWSMGSALVDEQLTLTLLAINCFEADHDDLPISIEALMPAYLQTLPIDYFHESHEPIVYSPAWSMIYSVGMAQQWHRGEDIRVAYRLDGKDYK